MSGCFLDTTVFVLELSAALDIATADDDGQLAAEFFGLLDLLSNHAHFFHANAAFTRVRKTLARQLKDDALIGGLGSRLRLVTQRWQSP